MSGAVVTFDESTDGEPIEGDLQVDGERMTLWGNGVDETILDGTLTLASNNSRVRGLTVTGDLVVARNSNNVAISQCRVYGDLIIRGNGAVVMGCEVFGDLRVEGNGSVLAHDGVGGALEQDRGECYGVYRIDDASGDNVVDAGERGEALCPQG